ncbi:MAG: nucleotidyltransferase domain-containing protein [Anaerolineales bacterium]|jgi:predicted nucleotidyltransferase
MSTIHQESIGLETEPEEEVEIKTAQADTPSIRIAWRDHWQWRLRSAEALAAQLDPERFGVRGLYIFGSTKNATAGPESDIDILIHFRGTDAQRKELRAWLEGWSLCLGYFNYLHTGYKVGDLLDIHIITDEDIKNQTSYAVKIGAITDAARPLTMKDDHMPLE